MTPMIWGRILSIIAGVLILSIISTVFPATASAATDWLDDELTTSTIDQSVLSTGCFHEEVIIEPGAKTANICVYEADNWRYGVYHEYGQYPWEPTKTNLVVSFSGEQAMYIVEGFTPQYDLIYAGRSNHIIFNETPWENNGKNETKVSIIKNFPSRIERTSVGYTLKPNSIEPLLANESGESILLKSSLTPVSKNGKWFIAMVDQVGLVRINLETFEKRWFSKYKVDYTHSFGVGMATFLVSDDGRYVGRSGWQINPTIGSVTEDCGKEITTFHTDWIANPASEAINTCPERDVSPEIREGKNHTVISAQLQSMSADGNEIEGYVSHWTLDDNDKPYIFDSERYFNLHRGEGYEYTHSIDYLALGDSYSSGEGDTERDVNGNKYYRSYTNNNENKPAGIPKEKCHISTRAYPYKLASAMSLTRNNPKQWDTIACSGAQAIDIAPQDRYSDKGQGNRLEGFNYFELKSNALNEMIPGRVKQIDFVKKYKPKAVTLTIGGNDVGFGDKLLACVTSSEECMYSQVEYRAKFRSQLLDQFSRLSKLYTELMKASYGQTKVYVLGYPQFINDDPAASCSNIFWMDVNERKMIVQAVSLMNNVIQKAAKKAGAYYIDIENSLGNHKLCDSEQDKYMTAITGVLGWNGNEEAESFHPNAKGHQAIATSVMGENNVNGNSLVTFETCLGGAAVCPDYSVAKEDIDIPSYFNTTPPSPSEPKTEYKTVVYGDSFAGMLARLLARPTTIASGSSYDAYLHSEPIHLGTFTAKADGSIDDQVLIPANVTPGYHTLVLKGQTYSGEPIEYEQVVLVKSSNPNDIDGDGITDAQDKCLFVQAVNIDVDGDGVDDACDPEIGEAPQDPYKVRAGNPAKTYAGLPEKADNLYIERNKNATAITGISGDYDSDGDGWIVVATSQNTTGATPYAKFWLTGVDGSKVPHLSFRTSEQGCVQYKPANLAIVTEQNNNSLRQLAQEAQDTNTCRSEPPEADADSNGAPDNTQPLYMARNGNTAITHTLPNGTTFTEDSRHLYLFRSTRAAEAQLGKTDYAKHNPALSPPATIPPTDTTDYRQQWSLIATTNPATPLVFAPATYAFPYSYSVMNGTYKKIDMVSDQPFVVTTIFSSPFYTQCSAYKPATLATIKQTTQHAQRLTQDWQQTMAVQMGGCI